MKTSSSVRLAAMATLCAHLIGTAHAESATYAGIMETYPVKRVMALGNGDSVVSGTADGVASIVATTGGMPMLLSVLCTGLGLIGDTDLEHLEFYCSFSADDANSFAVHGREDPSGATAQVIGGSGRWKDAAGSATFERVSLTDHSAQTNFTLDISSP